MGSERTRPTGAARFAHSRCPELDCLRHRLPPATLAAAERRALALDVGAERVLIAAREVAEDAYVVGLAASLRLAFEPLDDILRTDCPLSDEELTAADASGFLPVWIAGRPFWVMAPLTCSARFVIALVRFRPELAVHVRVTSRQRLRRFVTHHSARSLGELAADALRTADPMLSAGGRGHPHGLAWLLAIALAMSAAVMTPKVFVLGASAALTCVFAAWTCLRVLGLATRRRRWQPLGIRPDRLPLYTIIVALYREADAVEGLARALLQLDYPAEKLQIIFALEPDDHATQAAIARLNLGAPFEVVVAPKAGPRTKPKALNAALAFARGEFTAVFDAEDRPAPDQLRRALDVFFSEDDATGCVQAQLSIDNTRDSWLTRMYTAEYAGLFDVLLPGLAKRRLPLPLGGSSNHFRTRTLRKVGGWDAYNVTEDADLGMRLARSGYHAAVINSTTLEEAPYRFKHWLPQRTRWFKGWIQTWAVHMREPARLARDLGWGGFATFQLVVGGTVLAALVHPLFLAGLAYEYAVGGPFANVYLGALALGYSISALLGMIGLVRRGLISQALVLATTPVHWLLLSCAAWRALVQLARDPYRWEKTTHGLARTSRAADEAAAKESPRNTGASQPRPLRAAASG